MRIIIHAGSPAGQQHAGVRGADGAFHGTDTVSLSRDVASRLGAELVARRDWSRWALGVGEPAVFVSLVSAPAGAPSRTWVHTRANDRSLRLAAAIQAELAKEGETVADVHSRASGELEPGRLAGDGAACLVEVEDSGAPLRGAPYGRSSYRHGEALARAVALQLMQHPPLPKTSEGLSYEDAQARSTALDARGDASQHVQSDWAGVAILHRWLTGRGDWTISDDPRWTRYMQASESLRQTVMRELAAHAQGVHSSGTRDGAAVRLTFHVDAGGGEGIIGYHYLGGSNADVGDFGVLGWRSAMAEGDGTRVEYSVRFTFNDRVDPNPRYSTDTIKEVVGRIISLGRAEDYTIRISWLSTFSVHVPASGLPRFSGGWPATP